MLFQMQNKSFPFDEWIVLCTTLNINNCSKVGGNFEGILGNPGETPHIGCRKLQEKVGRPAKCVGFVTQIVCFYREGSLSRERQSYYKECCITDRFQCKNTLARSTT